MNDISITGYVNALFKKHDHNRNGKVELASTGPDPNETFGHDRYVDRRALFEDADADGDGSVTKAELTDLMGQYDENKNGELDAPFFYLNFLKFEAQRFAAAYNIPIWGLPKG